VESQNQKRKRCGYDDLIGRKELKKKTATEKLETILERE
jgi:hypothetical protein